MPPSPMKKTLKLTSDVIEGLAFAKATGFSKLVSNSNLNSTFRMQIVSKGFIFTKKGIDHLQVFPEVPLKTSTFSKSIVKLQRVESS